MPKMSKVKQLNSKFKQEKLPSRHAMATLTGGDPTQRSFGNYAKATPGVGDSGPNLVQAGSQMSGPGAMPGE